MRCMTTATKTTTLPSGIEIFKAGVRVDDAGVAHTITAADVAATAAAYDPALHEAPLCVGHPEHNLPAYGWVAGLSHQGDVLTMDSKQVEVQFAEMVKAGRVKKRSACFYPPDHARNPKPGVWYLRHVAFLGAQPPAVAGLKDIQFSEDEADGCVSFSEGADGAKSLKEQKMDEAEKAAADAKAAQEKAEAEAKAAREAQLAAEAATKVATDKLAQFAEAQRTERHAAFVSFSEAQVKAGLLKPADKGSVVAVLDLLADLEGKQVVSFSEGDTTKTVSPVEVIKALVTNSRPVVSFGEHEPGSAGAGNGTKGMSDAEIDAAAKKYAREKNVNYAEALTAVASFTA